MHAFERDYRYLLLNLLPQHRLSKDTRRDVETALRGGDGAELRLQAIRALEELCAASYFERRDLERAAGHVLVGYRRRGGKYRVRVSVPDREWALLVDRGVAKNGGTDRRNHRSRGAGGARAPGRTSPCGGRARDRCAGGKRDRR